MTPDPALPRSQRLYTGPVERKIGASPRCTGSERPEGTDEKMGMAG